MIQAPTLKSETKQIVEQLLAKACTDIQFRELLLRNPESALADSGLSTAEIGVLTSMKRVALEEWGVDVRRFRSFLRDNGNKITPIAAAQLAVSA
jgi:hypothetical protein